MAYLRLHIDLDRNKAFKPDFRPALTDTLQRLATLYGEKGYTCIRIKDPNGSFCGMFEIVQRKPKKKVKK